MNLKNQVCYYCGDTATSREHIPPEQMFVGFECNKITVPSCELHNEMKSYFDDCILKGFLRTMHNFSNGKIEKILKPEVVKALEVVKDKFPQVKKMVKDIEMFLPGEDPHNRNLIGTWMDGKVDFDGWIKKVTAGLIWDATKEFSPELDWVEKAGVRDNFWLETGRDDPRLKFQEMVDHSEDRRSFIEKFDKFPWVDGWSAHPVAYPTNLYSFTFCYSPSGTLWFCHTFFTRFRMWVGIKCSSELASKVEGHKIARELRIHLESGGSLEDASDSLMRKLPSFQIGVHH